MPKPIYRPRTRHKGEMFDHDCSTCIYLGHIVFFGHCNGWKDFDLYYCSREPTIIARYGDNPDQYMSGLEFGKPGKRCVDSDGKDILEMDRSSYPLIIAYKKAQEIGLIPDYQLRKYEYEIDGKLTGIFGEFTQRQVFLINEDYKKEDMNRRWVLTKQEIRMDCKCCGHDRERHGIDLPFACLDCECEAFEYAGRQHKTWDDYYGRHSDEYFDHDEFLSDFQPEN